jgi:hypothetical protein
MKLLPSEEISHGRCDIAELLSDNLSNVPDDIFSDSDSDDSVIMKRERKIVFPLRIYSESQASSYESDDNNDTSNAGATTWVE